ncbi:hypothetical protein [Psychrilyobacter sp.]|uniref:hypothetical protein n=1 Tax=Psychrilyobacter sp. TaxID=2586924 RepID=UPI003016FD16
MKSRNIDLYNKIQNILSSKKITKTSIAKEIGISLTAFSLQLRALREGRGISTNTLIVLEEVTGEMFLNL